MRRHRPCPCRPWSRGPCPPRTGVHRLVAEGRPAQVLGDEAAAAPPPPPIIVRAANLAVVLTPKPSRTRAACVNEQHHRTHKRVHCYSKPTRCCRVIVRRPGSRARGRSKTKVRPCTYRTVAQGGCLPQHLAVENALASGRCRHRRQPLPDQVTTNAGGSGARLKSTSISLRRART